MSILTFMICLAAAASAAVAWLAGERAAITAPLNVFCATLVMLLVYTVGMALTGGA